MAVVEYLCRLHSAAREYSGKASTALPPRKARVPAAQGSR